MGRYQTHIVSTIDRYTPRKTQWPATLFYRKNKKQQKNVSIDRTKQKRYLIITAVGIERSVYHNRFSRGNLPVQLVGGRREASLAGLPSSDDHDTHALPPGQMPDPEHRRGLADNFLHEAGRGGGRGGGEGGGTRRTTKTCNDALLRNYRETHARVARETSLKQ